MLNARPDIAFGTGTSGSLLMRLHFIFLLMFVCPFVCLTLLPTSFLFFVSGILWVFSVIFISLVNCGFLRAITFVFLFLNHHKILRTENPLPFLLRLSQVKCYKAALDRRHPNTCSLWRSGAYFSWTPPPHLFNSHRTLN